MIIKFGIFWKFEGQGLNQLSFGIREMLTLCTTYHQLNVKLLAFISERFYLTKEMICVKDGAWYDFQWVGDGCQTWGLMKIVSGWYLCSTSLKFLSSMSLLRLSRTISSHPSTSPFLYPIDFGLDIEVNNLNI